MDVLFIVCVIYVVICAGFWLFYEIVNEWHITKAYYESRKEELDAIDYYMNRRR